MGKAKLAIFSKILGDVLRLSLPLLFCLSALGQPTPEISTNSAHLLSGNDAAVSSSPVVSPTPGSAMVPIAFRGGKGMLLSHRWIEVQTSNGPVTLGFGSALLPFVDRGQITVQNAEGQVEHKYALHFVPPLSFGRAPGMGKDITQTLYVAQTRADQIVNEQRHRRFIFPYVPFLHDCRTYVCAMQATIQGKSKLPCYLLLKGYW
jgi:hypothetical protein